MTGVNKVLWIFKTASQKKIVTRNLKLNLIVKTGIS